MTTEAWPFLVSRNRELDYRTVVAPNFICDAEISGLLARAADGDLTEQRYAIYREIHNSKVGDITLVFRIVEAVVEDIGLEGNGTLKDPFGREIYLVEGIVLRETIPDVAVTHEDFKDVHKQLVEHYRNFWDCARPTPAIPSEPFNFQTDKNSSELLIHKIKPLIVGFKPTATVKQGKSWQCVVTHPTNTQVSSVAFNPDGNVIAIRYDQVVTIWDLSKRHSLCSFSGPPILIGGSVSSVAFSPDGRFLATGIIENADQNVVKRWDWRTGEEKNLFGHAWTWKGRIHGIAFSPDNQLLASSSEDKTIKLWDVPTGGEIHTLSGHSSSVRTVTISPDGQTLASADGEGIIKLWNLRSYREIRTIEAQSPPALPVNSVVFSPDGQTLASGSDDTTIKLWDVETGEVLRTFSGHTGKVTSVAFNPDRQTLASGSIDARIRLWDVNTGKEVVTLTGHEGRVNSVAFSVDGQTLVSGGKDGTIKIWQLR